MNRIIQLFLRFSSTFLFFFLEVICFALIIQYNSHQQKVFTSTSGSFFGTITKKNNDVRRYFSLYEEIEQLKLENVALRKQLEYSNYKEKKIVNDTLTVDSLVQNFSYIPATITAKNIIGAENTIRIDKGSVHGIRPHMGVITHEGVVGVVTQVSPHYATVMCLQHRDAGFSVMLKKNEYFGSLRWEPTDFKKAVLKELPKYVDVQQGDTLVTSGYSSLFPKGLWVGIVDQIEVPKGGSAYLIDVELSYDLLDIQHVYVVDNLLMDEIEELEADE